MTWATLPAALEIVGIVLQPAMSVLDGRDHNDLGSYELHTCFAKHRNFFSPIHFY